MLYIIIALLMFGMLIALHELGHFIAAKLCGVKVNEFAIGMGPRLLHRKGRETEYTLRALPIGGFCAMEGEEEGSSDHPRAFPNRPWWQRAIILVSGALMNFLTGFVIIVCLFSSAEGFYTPTITGFMEGFPLEGEQGLMVGDRVRSIDGHRVFLQSDITFLLNRSDGMSVDVVVERKGERVELKDLPLTLREYELDGAVALKYGLYLGDVEEANFLVRIKYAALQSVDYARIVWLGVSDLLSGAVGLREMSGVVGITSLMGEAGEAGAQAAQAAGVSAFLGAMLNILSLVAFIAINLGVMNLLPIPGLDGGQLLFLAVNGLWLTVTGKKLDPKYMNAITMAGFVLLFALMLVVTLSDILKQFGV